MTLENPPFEDVFPIENQCHVSFQGCTFYHKNQSTCRYIYTMRGSHWVDAWFSPREESSNFPPTARGLLKCQETQLEPQGINQKRWHYLIFISLDDLVEVAILRFLNEKSIFLTPSVVIWYFFSKTKNLIYHLFVLLMMHMLHMFCHCWNFLKLTGTPNHYRAEAWSLCCERYVFGRLSRVVDTFLMGETRSASINYKSGYNPSKWHFFMGNWCFWTPPPTLILIWDDVRCRGYKIRNVPGKINYEIYWRNRMKKYNIIWYDLI